VGTDKIMVRLDRTTYKQLQQMKLDTSVRSISDVITALVRNTKGLFVADDKSIETFAAMAAVIYGGRGVSSLDGLVSEKMVEMYSKEKNILNDIAVQTEKQRRASLPETIEECKETLRGLNESLEQLKSKNDKRLNMI